MVKCPHKVGQFGRGNHRPTALSSIGQAMTNAWMAATSPGHDKENIRQCLLMRCLPVVAGAGIDF